jgi:hypothetical protein
MEYEARVALEPLTHIVMLVSPIVVHDKMERYFAGELSVQCAQKVQKLLMPMALITLANQPAKNVERFIVQTCGK